ncbi:MAG: ABC transporter ATP-binding protein [Chloroflexia bacterium]|jgi:putative spermidine/putrescine transport system ATP-binding protein|nr:ABC transporter ATP-binding protein [Chloroflexia bacterium]
MNAQAQISGQESSTLEAATERAIPRIERLRIRGLTKRFGEMTALQNFDLDVEGGEFISLLGPSGCGKTTALNCLAGLLEPDAGEIELDGKSVVRTPPERRRFGMVFQNYALFPHLTVGRNVAFGLEMQRLPKAQVRERVDRVLALVRLQEQRDKHPAQLSGGQQQRIAIARAIVTEPRLLLMDEPLSNLDAKLRQEMRTEIRRIHQALGLTTIYVTHDQEEALSLSDRIVLMRHGVIRQVGTPREVYIEPASAYAANFLGARNLLPVRIAAVAEDVQVETRSGIVLRGTPRGSFSAGDEAIASIRPEDVALLAHGDGGDNTFPGAVVTVEFLGRGIEVSVRSGLAEEVVARTDDLWRQGDSVALRFPPERLLVFPAEDPGEMV